MRPLDGIDGGNNAVWAVVLGAFLATLGGFLATQFESWLRRRERKRGAALLFGDIVGALGELTYRASEARGRGDPYGPITMRMMRAARREIDLYDRNRELLYDLHDANLRVKLHTLMLTIAMPLDSLLDVDQEIRRQELAVTETKAGTAARKLLVERIEQLKSTRDLGFDFVVQTAADGQAMIRDLDGHAGVSRASSRPGDWRSNTDAILRNTAGPAPTGQAAAGDGRVTPN